MKDYYSILGIERNASEEDIKRAYRKAALKSHPDKGGDPEKFKEISEAYETLSDSNKKTMYDRGEDPNNNVRHQDPFEFHNAFFQQFFGNNFNQGPQKRSNHQHQITVDLADVHTGIEKNLKINIKRVCFDCKRSCDSCNGRGVVFMRNGPFQVQQTCGACRGSGNINFKNQNCKECKGTSEIIEDRLIKLSIEKCISSGSFMKFDGLGEQPQKRGEIPGDLLIQIVIRDHPLFKREHDHLIYTSSLTFKESIVGKKIVIPTFDGDLDLFTGNFGVINPNRVYHVKNRGLGGRGDLVLKFNIMYPETKFSDELLEQFMNLPF